MSLAVEDYRQAAALLSLQPVNHPPRVVRGCAEWQEMHNLFCRLEVKTVYRSHSWRQEHGGGGGLISTAHLDI